MSKSALDRTVRAMVSVAEDSSAPLPQRTKAADIVRQLLKIRPAKKRRSAALNAALKNMGIKPAKPAHQNPSA